MKKYWIQICKILVGIIIIILVIASLLFAVPVAVLVPNGTPQKGLEDWTGFGFGRVCNF